MIQQDEKPVILAVDDESGIIDILIDILKADYTLLVARDGPSALKSGASAEPFLINRWPVGI
jgi:CheY-like chemotaxis protein